MHFSFASTNKIKYVSSEPLCIPNTQPKSNKQNESLARNFLFIKYMILKWQQKFVCILNIQQRFDSKRKYGGDELSENGYISVWMNGNLSFGDVNSDGEKLIQNWIQRMELFVNS